MMPKNKSTLQKIHYWEYIEELEERYSILLYRCNNKHSNRVKSKERKKIREQFRAQKKNVIPIKQAVPVEYREHFPNK